MKNKPRNHQNITITKKVPQKVRDASDAFWAEWDARDIKSETYLKVPRSVSRFSKHDPRKSKWRRNLTTAP